MMKRNVVLFGLMIGCNLIMAEELLLSSAHDMRTVLTPCEDNNDCDGLQSAVCVENLCYCNGSHICIDKTSVTVTKIGESCSSDSDCNIEHSVCKEEQCSCIKGKVVSEDKRRCLTIAKGLDSTCTASVQCYAAVPHSGCQDDRCTCQQQMHAYNGSCYTNVGLGEKCAHHGECSGTVFADCVLGICMCRDNYVKNSVANKCLDIVTKINGPCYEDVQCSHKFGKAECKEGHCQCEELYEYKFKKDMCVRDMLLGEICINHTDCHGIEPGPSRLECILGECKCQSEYVEHYGFCSSDGFRTSNIVELTLLCIVVVCWFIFSETVVVAWIALALAIFYMFWIMIIGNYFFDNNNYMWRPERND